MYLMTPNIVPRVNKTAKTAVFSSASRHPYGFNIEVCACNCSSSCVMLTTTAKVAARTTDTTNPITFCFQDRQEKPSKA